MVSWNERFEGMAGCLKCPCLSHISSGDQVFTAHSRSEPQPMNPLCSSGKLFLPASTGKIQFWCQDETRQLVEPLEDADLLSG